MGKNFSTISKSQFDHLPLKIKGKLVLLETGKFIGIRYYYNQKLVLYSMGEFFAEVWYEPGENKIKEITSLSLDDNKIISLYIDSNRSH